MDKLYLFTQPSCVNCPAVKARLKEEKIDFEEINVNEISIDLTMKLLKDNIYIIMTPALIKEENGKYAKTTLNEVLGES
jgi:glutaredoxin